jgi:glycosyltransferase involved in cell wall biosynthesis
VLFCADFTIRDLQFTIMLMRILQISSATEFGGGERHFVDLCRSLVERNHEVFVVLRPTNKWQDKLDFLTPENISHVSIRNSFGIFSGQKIAKLIRKNSIEIVHAHVARDYFPTSLACRIAKNQKFIITRHVLFPLKSFYRFALKNLAKAIAVSSAVETELVKTFPRDKITAISNGINVDYFGDGDKRKLGEQFRFEHNIPFDSRVITIVGELKALKGQEDFVLASQIIAEKFPEIYFVIVGKEPAFEKKYRQKLKRLVKVLGLKEKYLWLNWVEDTATLFHASDVFVSASHTESFGLAILEAMASGTAIVATETKGASELLGNENLVPIENPTKLAEAICDILSDEAKRNNLIERNQVVAKKRFTLKRMVDETENLYKSIL